MINNDHSLDSPAPTPGLGPDSWAGLEPEAIGARQRAARGRDLARQVDRYRPSQDQAADSGPADTSASSVGGTDGGPAVTSGRSAGSAEPPASKVKPTPGGELDSTKRPKIKVAPAHRSKSSLPPVTHRDPTVF